MSKEGLLISILKSGQSIAELRKSNNNNNVEIKKIKEKFNVLRNNFSKKNKKIEEIRQSFYRKERADHRLKELEKKKSLTEQEEIEKNITLKN